MKNQTTKAKQTKEDLILAEIIGFYVVQRTSKNGNEYKCIIAIDEHEKEYFVCFAK